MSSAGQTAGEMKSVKTVWPYPVRDNLLQICQALAPFIPFGIKVPVENMSGNWSFGVNLYSLVECLTQRRREAESAEKSQNQKEKKDMTRNDQGISFTQLVKTTTTPIKRRNLLKLCRSAPLRDI